MKKLVIFILLFLSFIYSSSGQLKDGFNASLFTGGYFAQQNVNNQGYWYGIYSEYLPLKTPDYVSFGFCFLLSSSSFKNNTTTSMYEGTSSQIGLGFIGGKYWEFFSLRHSAYLGVNLMLKKTIDEGEGMSWSGIYQMQQEDYIISSELNFNLLKAFAYNKRYFPRLQFKLGFQKPLASKKQDYWNGEEIPESVIWNKAGINSEFKLSLIELGYLENRSHIKTFVGYQYFRGDTSHWLIFGPEFSLKKWEKDDWMSLQLFIKQRVGNYERSLNDTHFGLNLVFTYANN